MQVHILHPGEQSHPGVRPSGRLSRARWKASAQPIPPWSYLPHASRRHHGWDEAEAWWSTMGLPVLAASYFPELRGAANIANTDPLANAFARAPRKHKHLDFLLQIFLRLSREDRVAVPGVPCSAVSFVPSARPLRDS
ncbi:unnamed protein product [Prunus armeniaca]